MKITKFPEICGAFSHAYSNVLLFAGQMVTVREGGGERVTWDLYD